MIGSRMYLRFVALNFGKLVCLGPTRSFIVAHKGKIAVLPDGASMHYTLRSVRNVLLRLTASMIGNSPKVADVVQSWCSACRVRVNWKIADIDGQVTDAEPLDAPTSFACEHWQEHHEASLRACLNPSGQSRSGFVSGKVLTKPQTCTAAQPVARNRQTA